MLKLFFPQAFAFLKSLFVFTLDCKPNKAGVLTVDVDFIERTIILEVDNFKGDLFDCLLVAVPIVKDSLTLLIL